jgi:hypothetical protein
MGHSSPKAILANSTIMVAVGIAKHIERYSLQEKCAELTDNCIALWSSMVSNPNCPWVLRLAAADRLMDRAYGKPPQAVMMDATTRETSLRKIIHELRSSSSPVL